MCCIQLDHHLKPSLRYGAIGLGRHTNKGHGAMAVSKFQRSAFGSCSQQQSFVQPKLCRINRINMDKHRPIKTVGFLCSFGIFQSMLSFGFAISRIFLHQSYALSNLEGAIPLVWRAFLEMPWSVYTVQTCMWSNSFLAVVHSCWSKLSRMGNRLKTHAKNSVENTLEDILSHKTKVKGLVWLFEKQLQRFPTSTTLSSSRAPWRQAFPESLDSEVTN